MVVSPNEIIERLGGTNAVAKGLGICPSAVSNWLARGRIPAERWAEIVAFADANKVNDITMDALAAMRVRRLPSEVLA